MLHTRIADVEDNQLHDADVMAALYTRGQPVLTVVTQFDMLKHKEMADDLLALAAHSHDVVFTTMNPLEAPRKEWGVSKLASRNLARARVVLPDRGRSLSTPTRASLEVPT